MDGCSEEHHEGFRSLLAEIRASGDGAEVGLDVIGRVLARVALASPAPVPQVDIAHGSMLVRPSVLSVATVARAVNALCAQRLLRRERAVSDRPGRPVIPLSFDVDGWLIVGVHVAYRSDHVVEISAAAFDLNLRLIGTAVRVDLQPEGLTVAGIAEPIADACKRIIARNGKSRRVLGAGIEIGAQVHVDHVIETTRRGREIVALGPSISRLLKDVPVVVENDLNALAIKRTYEIGIPTFGLVAVFEEGIGAASVAEARLQRGQSGGAGEIGHIAVEFTENADGDVADCPCGQRGHVEGIATPLAMSRRLGTSIDDAATTPAIVGDRLSREALELRRGGTALGRGVAAWLTLTNPGPVTLYLPPALAEARPGTSGALYLQAVEEQVDYSFATAAADARGDRARLDTRSVPPEEVWLRGAESAAACVLHGLIEHARNRHRCRDRLS